MSKRNRRRTDERNFIADLLPAKRSEAYGLTLVREVVPLLERAIRTDGSVDRPAAVAVLTAEIESSLEKLRRMLEMFDRFDAIRRMSVRQLAHDPNTYVESEHDGSVAAALLVLAVAAEFDSPRAATAEPCAGPALEELHYLAGHILRLAPLRDGFLRPLGKGGADAAHLAKLNGLHWRPSAWPEDREALLGELLSGPGGRALVDVCGFTYQEFLDVMDALWEASQALAVAALLEPKPFELRPGAVASLATVDAEVIERVISCFATGLGQSRVVDPIEAVAERRVRSVLEHEGEICWVSPDLFAWAVQVILEDGLKGERDFNRYQKHRSRLVERIASGLLGDVLQPDSNHAGETYSGSQGAGQLDGLLVVDRIAIVIEAKAQMISGHAWAGHEQRLHRNLSDILGTGTEQIGRFIRTLRADGHVELLPSRSTLNALDIDHVFGVVVTLDDLASLGTATAEIRDLGVALDGDAAAVVFSLHGLQDAVRLLNTPSALLHYLARRRATSERYDIFAPEELDIVMYHLKQNLFHDDLPLGTTLSFGVETDELTEWDSFRRGTRSVPARKPAQRIPIHVARLVEGLEMHRPSGWVEPVLDVLNLGAKGRTNLNRFLRDARKLMRADRSAHDITITWGEDEGASTGLSIAIGFPGTPDLVARADFLTNLNGLRYNSHRWTGIAIEAQADRLTPIYVNVAHAPFDQVVRANAVAPAPKGSGNRRRTWRL